MAERRMLHKKASVSTDLSDFHQAHGGDALAFYLLAIPHMDRWGCLPADPAKLRIMVVPGLPITADQIKAWTAWMVRRGMLEKVTGPVGDKGLRSPDFHEHQRGTDFHRESPSPYEPPDITKQWVRTGKKPNSADLQESRRRVADQSPTSRKRVGAKGKEVRPFPPTPQGASTEDEEAHPEGSDFGLAPRPNQNHDNGNDTDRRTSDLTTAADVLAAMLERQAG